MCCDCKKSFCSLCSVLQDNLRRCATCDLLRATAFQRPLLMRLRVKDLRQYLLLRNIPTDTCREKEDLVDLVLCHQGAESDVDEEEEEPDTPTLQTRPLYDPPPAPPPPSALEPPASTSSSQISPINTSQGEALSRSNSSGSTNQVRGAGQCPFCLYILLAWCAVTLLSLFLRLLYLFFTLTFHIFSSAPFSLLLFLVLGSVA